MNNKKSKTKTRIFAVMLTVMIILSSITRVVSAHDRSPSGTGAPELPARLVNEDKTKFDKLGNISRTDHSGVKVTYKATSTAGRYEADNGRFIEIQGNDFVYYDGLALIVSKDGQNLKQDIGSEHTYGLEKNKLSDYSSVTRDSLALNDGKTITFGSRKPGATISTPILIKDKDGNQELFAFVKEGNEVKSKTVKLPKNADINRDIYQLILQSKFQTDSGYITADNSGKIIIHDFKDGKKEINSALLTGIDDYNTIDIEKTVAQNNDENKLFLKEGSIREENNGIVEEKKDDKIIKAFVPINDGDPVTVLYISNKPSLVQLNKDKTIPYERFKVLQDSIKDKKLSKAHIDKAFKIPGFFDGKDKTEFKVEKGKIVAVHDFSQKIKAQETYDLDSDKDDPFESVALVNANNYKETIKLQQNQYKDLLQLMSEGVLSDNAEIYTASPQEGNQYAIKDTQSDGFFGSRTREVVFQEKNGQNINQYFQQTVSPRIPVNLFHNANAFVAVLERDKGNPDAKEIFFVKQEGKDSRVIRAVKNQFIDYNSGFLDTYIDDSGSYVTVEYGQDKKTKYPIYNVITLKDKDGKDVTKQDSEVVRKAKDVIFVSRIGIMLEKAADAARGATALGNFLFKGNELIEAWQNTVDEIFKYIEPQQLLTGLFCDSFVRRGGEQGSAYTFVKDDLQIVAHVEGSRYTVQGVTNQGQFTEHFYKLTWVVKAPSDKEVKFNIRVMGQQEANLFSGFVKLKPGETHKVTGNAARVKFSKIYYDKICIVFDGDVDWPNPLCNNIVEQQGQTIEEAAAKQADQGAQGSGSSSGGEAPVVPVDNW